MSDNHSNGIGLCGATFIVFLTLRLTEHIDWEWYWVAAPLWMPAALYLSIIAAVLVVAAPFAVVDRVQKNRRRARRTQERK